MRISDHTVPMFPESPASLSSLQLRRSLGPGQLLRASRSASLLCLQLDRCSFLRFELPPRPAASLDSLDLHRGPPLLFLLQVSRFRERQL